MMKRQRKDNVALRLTLLIITAFMTYLNGLTPLFADDFSYSVSFVTKKPFNSFGEVVSSQYLHYFSTNGRTVVHLLAQVLLWGGKPMLNIVNGASFACLCLLICFHATGSLSRIRAWHVVIVFTSLWFLTPHFGGSYLWVMGAANYMYSPQIILIYLIRYRILMNEDEGKRAAGTDSLAGALIWLLAGLIAGWTNENTSLALICMVFSIIVIRLVQRKKVYRWIWAGFFGNIGGSLLLFLSPAQAKRLNAAGGFGDLGQWIDRFVSITVNALKEFYPLIVIFFIAGICFWMQSRKSPASVWFAKVEPTVIYTLGALVALYSMVGSPQFPVWAWSSILIFCLIAAMSLIYTVWAEKTVWRGKLRGGICALMMVSVICSFCNILPELIRVKDEYDDRERLIDQSVQSGEALTVVLIETDCTYSSYSLFPELNEDPNTWPNNAIANYYGISSICASTEETE